MKRTVTVYFLAFCLLLSGCGMGVDGGYLWQQSHPMQDAVEIGENISVSDYHTLYEVLEQAVEAGISEMTISVALYDRADVEPDMARAVALITRQNPIAAYAVKNIQWEQGSIGGEQVLVVQLSYVYDQSQIRKIRSVEDNHMAMEMLATALVDLESSIVLRIRNYTDTDFLQLVADYATENPLVVMETPSVSCSMYPEFGSDRVVELRFTYLTSREILRTMQQRVRTVVDATLDLVSFSQQPEEKYTQMYSLLVERNQSYTTETSLTPAYSMLLYGEGDSKAFATVYAAMCKKAGLECLTVVGTYNSELRYWNIVCIDGVYYHVDLLRSKEEGQFRGMSDAEMQGYMWYYPAYPTCGPAPEIPPSTD